MKYFFLSCIVFVLLLSSCAEEEKTVAEFGSHSITLDEFRIAYLEQIKRPDNFDSPELREKYLDQMIAVRLLASESHNILGDSLDETEQYKLDAYRSRCLRDAHYQRMIAPQIAVTERDIEDAYQYTQEERRIRHLFAPDLATAEKLHDALDAGKSFTELARQVFQDDSLAASGGDLGWVLWDQLDYELADAAFSLEVGEYSQPVQSQHGYHIIQVMDYKKRPLITRREYELHRSKAKYLLESKIGDQFAFRYINRMMADAEVTVYPPVLKIIKDNLRGVFTRAPQQTDVMADAQLTTQEIRQIETSLWDARNETVATANGQPLTVAQFIGYLNYIPYETLYQSFDQTVKFVIRDHLLTEEALAMGLEDDPVVRQKTRLFEEYIRQLEFRKEIVSGVRISADEIENYYQRHKEEYKRTPKEEVLPVVEKILRTRKRQEAVPTYVDSLLAGREVKKNLQLLHDYYDKLLKKGALYN